MLNGLDLFSGIGGISLALGEYARTVTYCENDRYCQSVLLNRMEKGSIPAAPVWDDVRTLTGDMLPHIDIIYGGFPCQDISVAGNGIGLEGKRSGLFFEIIRLVREIRPRFVFLENVPAITVRGLDRVLLELTALGYDSRWTIVSAAEVGACHQRDRWFLLAHTNGERGRHEQVCQSRSRGQTSTIDNSQDTPDANSLRELQSQGSKQNQRERFGHNSENLANADGKGLEGSGRQESKLARPVQYGGWKSQPTIRGRNHGVRNRVDRIRGLGNAVVPAQAREAFERLMGLTTPPAHEGEKGGQG